MTERYIHTDSSTISPGPYKYLLVLNKSETNLIPTPAYNHCCLVVAAQAVSPPAAENKKYVRFIRMNRLTHNVHVKPVSGDKREYFVINNSKSLIWLLHWLSLQRI